MTVIGINTSALMMLLRIYAMYEKNIKVVVLVAATFTVELGMNAWLLTKGIRECKPHMRPAYELTPTLH